MSRFVVGGGPVSGPVELTLIVAAVGFVLARRLLGEPVEAKRTLLLPAVLTGVGLVDLAKVAQSPLSIGFLVTTTMVGLVLGLSRGAPPMMSSRLDRLPRKVRTTDWPASRHDGAAAMRNVDSSGLD